VSPSDKLGQARRRGKAENRPPEVSEDVTSHDNGPEANVRSDFLAQYWDSGLKLPKDHGIPELEDQQRGRLLSALALVFVAGSISRRVGSEADDEELALDKKRAKRVRHALRQSLGGWVRKMPPVEVDDKTRREGAQLDWPLFVEAHLAQLTTEMRVVATWAIKNNEIKWGKSALVKLQNEQRWLNYAMRD